jgi:hypothetical protein
MYGISTEKQKKIIKKTCTKFEGLLHLSNCYNFKYNKNPIGVDK